MKLKPKQKKMLIVLICALAGMAVLIWLNSLDWESFRMPKEAAAESVRRKDIKFAEPDWEYDIYEDEAWLDKNRYIAYTEGAQTTVITDGQYKRFGPGIELLAKYFEAVMAGDADAIDGMYTPGLLEEKGETPDFTMQRVYNIEVELQSEKTLESGKFYGAKQYFYLVKYMIMKNDGTFRTDEGSDAAVPLLFEIIYDDEARINSITGYRYVN